MRIFKSNLPLIIIIAVSVIIRLIYSRYQPYIKITPDGLGYYAFGARLSGHRFIHYS
jgi:hypothetical protein